MRKLGIYVKKYGPEVGPRLYHALQSQAAYASVAARLRRKIEAIREKGKHPLPLFDASEAFNRDADPLAPQASP